MFQLERFCPPTANWVNHAPAVSCGGGFVPTLSPLDWLGTVQRSADAAHLQARLVAHRDVGIAASLLRRDPAHLDNALIVDPQWRIERVGPADPDLAEPAAPQRRAVALPRLLLSHPRAQRARRILDGDLPVALPRKAGVWRSAHDERLADVDVLGLDVICGQTASRYPGELRFIEPARPRRNDRARRWRESERDLGRLADDQRILVALRVV